MNEVMFLNWMTFMKMLSVAQAMSHFSGRTMVECVIAINQMYNVYQDKDVLIRHSLNVAGIRTPYRYTSPLRYVNKR